MLEAIRRFLARVARVIAWGLVVVVATLACAHYIGNPFSAFEGKKNVRVLHSIETVEEIALLSLGVQEIATDSEDRKDWTLKPIPGTTKTSNVQFSFQAKLGIDGEDVRMDSQGGNEYLITVPEFKFIGMENLDVQVLNEENGILSWFTPDVDKNEMLDEVIKTDLQDKYIDSNQEILRQQTENFYRGLVRAVDPEAKVNFAFAGE